MAFTKCIRCYGSGEVMGSGFMMAKCPVCDGYGDYEEKIVPKDVPKKRKKSSVVTPQVLNVSHVGAE